MKNFLIVSIFLLFALSLDSFSVNLKRTDVPGIYLGGDDTTGISCTGTLPNICFSVYEKDPVQTGGQEKRTGLFVDATSLGVCDIDGTNTTTDPVTGNTLTTIQTNPSTFNVNNFQDFMDWLLE